jgi:hypothetical protein
LHDKGNHPCLSEDWLLENLPEGWSYDAVIPWEAVGGQEGFIIGPRETLYEPGKALFIPLDLLVKDREVNK